MTMNTIRHFSIVVCGIALTSQLACTQKTDVASPASASSAPAAAPAQTVTVSTVLAQKRDMPVRLKTTGTVTALTSVDVRPQMNSVIGRVHIHEGQFVKAGALLFTLDARTEEANVAKAHAQLAKDQAALADAQRQLTRAQQLFSQNFISQGALDTHLAQVDSQRAVVAADRAAMDATRVALSYARVVAPHAGRVGAIHVFAGSAVQANVTPLVTVTQLDPIAVAFSLPQRNLADALAALKGGGATVSATLPDRAGTFTGRLKFVDNAVDASSGSVKVKAVFDNKDSQLWPGAFVEVAQTVTTLKDAVVIPQAAIVQNARGAVVYLAENGKAAQKPVQVLFAQGAEAAVSGINAGDAVVLDGKQNLRPGTPLAERAKEPAASGATGTSGTQKP